MRLSANRKAKSAPSQRELLSVAKLRELKRLFQIIKTPPVIFLFQKNDSPLKDGAEAQIEFYIKCGQGSPPTPKTKPLKMRLQIQGLIL